jgi:SHS2 domain-containing protein
MGGGTGVGRPEGHRMEEDPFERIPHTADIGIRVRGETVEALFVNAARAMFQILIGKRAAGAEDGAASAPGSTWDPIALYADDLPTLLRAWLAELLYGLVADGRVGVDFSIDLLAGPTAGREGGYALEASVRTEPYDSRRHVLETELKAVTYHQLRVEQRGNRWEAEVIFDV